MDKIFQQKETRHFLAGPVGGLELRINGVMSPSMVRGVAVICHPHPLYGGNLDNKVVFTLARVFQEAGIIAVRFNYRGIGASDGSYGEGRGELADLAAVMDWVRQQLPGLPITAAGFSFGGAIAAAYARDHADQLCAVVLVSPAIGHYGFEHADHVDVPVLLLQGEADETLPPEIAYRWAAESGSGDVSLVRLAETGHFYHGKLTELKQCVKTWLAR